MPTPGTGPEGMHRRPILHNLRECGWLEWVLLWHLSLASRIDHPTRECIQPVAGAVRKCTHSAVVAARTKSATSLGTCCTQRKPPQKQYFPRSRGFRSYNS